VVVGIVLVGDDVAVGLQAVGGSVFIHVDRTVMDLDEVIRIIAAGIAEDDIPAVEVCAVEEEAPT